MKPIIAIVGRPNVGKSTLFNRLIREKQAIVSDFPGLTRDRIYGESAYEGIAFTVIDTGGIIFHEADEIRKNVFEQTLFAIEEADILIFLLDGKYGLHPLDKEIALHLKKENKKIFFVINKIDTKAFNVHETDFFSLGVQDFIRSQRSIIEELIISAKLFSKIIREAMRRAR
jgi:GTP-binding protein